MKRIGTSVFVALLFVGVLGFTAFSQQTTSSDEAEGEIEVQILEENIQQELPIDITLLMSTTTGVQTITVPLKLNINLTVGPIDAVDLSVEVQNTPMLVSPLEADADVDEADDDEADEDEDSSDDDESEGDDDESNDDESDEEESNDG